MFRIGYLSIEIQDPILGLYIRACFIVFQLPFKRSRSTTCVNDLPPVRILFEDNPLLNPTPDTPTNRPSGIRRRFWKTATQSAPFPPPPLPQLKKRSSSVTSLLQRDNRSRKAQKDTDDEEFPRPPSRPYQDPPDTLDRVCLTPVSVHYDRGSCTSLLLEDESTAPHRQDRGQLEGAIQSPAG